ncbi:MAG: alpha/beta hydrolase [Piscinibacter sp.]|nr:alpha/beta hydrolase [Piscinibacter sp.]
MTQAVRIGSRRCPGEFESAGRDIGVVAFADGLDGAAGAAGNRAVVQVLHRYGLGTLCVGLAALDEALAWLGPQTGPAGTRVGVLAACEGAAEALRLAAVRPARIAAVVSCNGRVDPDGEHLALVHAPTLLIAGDTDDPLLALQRAVMRALRCEKRLEVVPGATPWLDQPVALDAVAQLAGAWFARHLRNGWR